MVSYSQGTSYGGSKKGGKPAIVEYFELIVGIVGAMAVVYFLMGLALDIIIDKMPNEFESAMEKIIHEEDYESPYYFVEAEIAAQEMLNKMAKRTFKKRQFTIHISNNSQMNAIALPGGHIVINSGLMRELKTENQLAFIIAHLLGHYKSGDHLRGVGRKGILAFVSISLFGEGSGITEMFTSSLDFKSKQYSIQQEIAADEFALDLLNLLYGHVSGGEEFLEIINQSQGTSNYTNFTKLHPLDETRLDVLRGYINSNGYRKEAQFELNPIVFRTYLFDK